MEKVDTLNQFLIDNKLQAKCVGMTSKGCMNVFDLKIENNFRLTKLSNLSQELGLMMKSYAPPTLKLDTDKGLLQVEVLAERMRSESLIKDLSSETLEDHLALNMSLGTSMKGEKIITDMSKNPHLLIGGSTGSGKSALLHNIISNLLISSNCAMFIADTKGIEFSGYSRLSKRVKIVDTASQFNELLKYLIFVMEKRYLLIKNHPWINPINNTYFKPIVLIIDEFADLTMQDPSKECYTLLCQLVQKSRACGIYCILATQRPSADIITGVIKANFPARIACRVVSKTDSRIILDENGAESLRNAGEAIIKNYQYGMEKFQVSYSPLNEIYKFLYEKMATNT
jgi:DNA segregation ATPase FtsK/SpoIIIE, S-DNA-T family